MQHEVSLTREEMINGLILLLKALGLNPKLAADGILGREAAMAAMKLIRGTLQPYQINMVIGFLLACDLAVPGLAADGTSGPMLELSLLLAVKTLGNEEVLKLLKPIEGTIALAQSSISKAGREIVEVRVLLGDTDAYLSELSTGASTARP